MHSTRAELLSIDEHAITIAAPRDRTWRALDRYVARGLSLTDGDTRLRARSYAVFPGLHGRLYERLALGTRLHVVATRWILRAVARECGEEEL